jgi:hypothetical protein
MKTEKLQKTAGSPNPCSISTRSTTRTFATTTSRFIGLLLISLMAIASAWGQLPVPASSQFDITGFIQSATLGGAGSGPGVGAHAGGFITVNGHLITVPSETIVILPANALTWQELFAQAPAPYTGAATGMAQADVPAPLTTYEAHVIGNRVVGGPAGADLYIAGLVYITQQGLNSGQGFINCISYANPAATEMFVGGPSGTCTGARIRINDPAVGLTGTGRYGVAFTPDARFTVDQDNPTIQAITGYPMCLPRVAPPGVDPLCPLTQRPLVGNAAAACTAPATAGAPCTSFTMANPAAVALGGILDPRTQAPFMVGDFVTYAGTLVNDSAANAGPTAGPWPAAGAAATYIAAHTIVDNTAIYTVGGTNPAYVTIGVSLIGTGGLTVIGGNEAAIRTRFEGFTSDVDAGVNPGSVTNTFPSQRLIKLYGIDLNALTGAPSDRYWGVIGVDPGPPTGAAKGRWRFRPPCAAFGTVPAKPDKQCVGNPADSFLPPTREVRAVIGTSQDGLKAAAWVPGQTTAFANGIIAGQYHAPIADYIFPEQLPGKAPIPENNFNTMPFLAQGGYTSSAGTLVGQLNPWPSNITPLAACIGAVANAGGPYAVASGGSVTLNGTSTGDLPIAFAWTATAGSFSNAALPNPVYTAPAGPATPTLTLTATNCGGTVNSTSIATVNVSAPLAPTVTAPTAISVLSGAAGSFAVSGSDPNVPALLPLTFTAVQAGAPALNAFTVTQAPPAGATINFVAPVLPLGQVTPATVTITTTARNTAGAASPGANTVVTVNPLADNVIIQTAIYRTSQKRLVITATSSVISPNVVLKLQPYVATDGTTYNPDGAAGGVGNVFTNNGGGAYTLTLNAVPAPACGNPAAYATPCPTRPLQVKSNLNGTSVFTALTQIRQ